MTEVVEGLHFLLAAATSSQTNKSDPLLLENGTKEDYVHWTRSATLQLLEFYDMYRSRVGVDIKTFKQLWKLLSNLMKTNSNINASPGQCENRWRVLERTYRKFVNNNKSGRARKQFEYEKEMGRILHSKKNKKPPIVLSSEDVDPLSKESLGDDHIYLNRNSASTSNHNNTHPIKRTNTDELKTSENSKKIILENIRNDKVKFRRERLHIEKQQLNIENERLQIARDKLAERKRRNNLIEERNQLLKLCIQNNVPSKDISIL